MASKTYIPAYSRSRPPSETGLQVEMLLARYPKLSEYELEALIDAVPYLSMRDYALMTADSQFVEKLVAFERDHGEKLWRPVTSLLSLIMFGIIIVAGTLSLLLA